MSDQTTLELASTRDLIEELFRRDLFVGVLIHVEPEVRGEFPRIGDQAQIH